jgi:hypothetical protein
LDRLHYKGHDGAMPVSEGGFDFGETAVFFETVEANIVLQGVL